MNTKSKFAVKDLAYCAVFVVLITIGAFLKIPIPYVPISLQITFTTMAGLMLGAKLGFLSVLVYMLLGLCGVPIFTGGGGFAYVMQPSFGYIIGFVFGALVSGYIVEKRKSNSYWTHFIAAFVGLLVVYLIAVPYLILIMKFYVGTTKSIGSLIVSYFVMLFPKDVAVMALACLLTTRLTPIINRSRGKSIINKSENSQPDIEIVDGQENTNSQNIVDENK